MSTQREPHGFGSHGHVVRVLIVDDHQILASSLSLVLDVEPDLTVVGTAGSLEQARRLIVSCSPDVVLLDHRLPDGDGVAALRELRALASLSASTRSATTARASPRSWVPTRSSRPSRSPSTKAWSPLCEPVQVVDGY